MGNNTGKLTDRQKNVVQEILADPGMPHYEAYMKHYPRSRKENAITSVYKLLQKPQVGQYMTKMRAVSQHLADVRMEEATQELKILAFSNIVDFFDFGKDGSIKLKNLESLPPSLSRAIKKIKTRQEEHTSLDGSVTVTTTVEIELYDKLRAMDLLSKQQGWYQSAKGNQNQPLGVIVVPAGKTVEEMLNTARVVDEQ